jgi:hypothetical protein
MLSRRGLITGLVALVAAPAVIRTPGLLMPVRNIAATGWVLDPVAMAISCLEFDLGYKDFVTPDGRRYQSASYDVPKVHKMDHDAAAKRVSAFINRPSDAELERQAIAEARADHAAWLVREKERRIRELEQAARWEAHWKSNRLALANQLATA